MFITVTSLSSPNILVERGYVTFERVLSNLQLIKYSKLREKWVFNSRVGNGIQGNATCVLFNPSETARRKDV